MTPLTIFPVPASALAGAHRLVPYRELLSCRTTEFHWKDKRQGEIEVQTARIDRSDVAINMISRRTGAGRN